jgi:hypothetical protein
MSLFVEDDMTHVAQLQGISKIEMPPSLKGWAERMLRACMGVRARRKFSMGECRANSRFTIHMSTLGSLRMSADEKRTTFVQAHHCGSARALGWPLEGAWFKWNNPNYVI